MYVMPGVQDAPGLIEGKMTDNRNRKITPVQRGMFGVLSNRVKLIARLLADSRVSPLIKLLPIGTLVYLVVPDLIPTPIDDGLIIWLGTSLFVELCPPEVVAEHQKALDSIIQGEWQDPKAGDGDEEIIDAEYWERK